MSNHLKKLLSARFLVALLVISFSSSCTVQPEVPEPDGTPDEVVDPDPPVDPPVTQPTPQFTLSIDVAGSGSVTPSGGLFDEGTTVTLTATPDDGWRFGDWTGEGTTSDNTIEVVLDQDRAVTASFIQQFFLDVQIDGDGLVELDPPGGTYDAGTIVSVSAIPENGFAFARWEGDLTSQSESESLTMDSPKLITAFFERRFTGPVTPPPVARDVILTIADSGPGSVEVDPPGTPVVVTNGQGWIFTEGTVVQLTARSDADGCFKRWGGDLESVQSTLQTTLTDDTFVLAEFLDINAPPPSPVVDPHPTQTTSPTIQITGNVATCQTDAAANVEITGPAGTTLAAVSGGAFTADVTLRENRVNQLFFTAVSGTGVRGTPTTTVITQDSQAPELHIDFPPDGAELTVDAIDVAGRVSDMLTGFLGLTVTVDNVIAQVDVGIGTNGSFERQAVPLTPGDNVIVARATDRLGNSIKKTITVKRVAVPSGAPTMTVVSGNSQTAAIHNELPDPIVVEVKNSDGSPFSDKAVTFKITRSDGAIHSDSDPTPARNLQVTTDSNGLARAYWKLGADAGCGNNRIEVTSTSVVGSTFFCASATPAPPVQINIGSGNNQRGEAGGPAAEPLRVWVNDRCNGVEGVPVTFRVVRGDGRVNDRSSVTVETSDTGHAEVNFTLGAQPGNNIIEANFATNPTQPAEFVVFGIDRDPARPTSFSAIVLDNANQPLQGADCILQSGLRRELTVSDINGICSFDTLSFSGPTKFYVNGLAVFHVGGVPGTDVPAGSFPALTFEPVIVPNAENALPTPVLLPPLNPNNAVTFDNSTDVELTVEGMDGLKMIVRAGSMTRADGSTPSPADPAILALNQVHFDKVPMPIPDGAAPPFAWTLQPGGAVFDPPVEIHYPNMSGLPAGSVAYFLSFNHDTMRFEIVATGSVTDDGSQIISDPGSGITIAGWGCNCPPYSATGDCEDCDSESNVAANDEECTECDVTISGNTCVRANEEIVFSAIPNPEGGTFDWAGGNPVGADNGPIFVTKFDNAQTTFVTVEYTCPEGQVDVSRVVVNVFEDKFVVTGGLLGDVVTVDLSCLGLENLTLSANSNSNGFVAKRINADSDTNYVDVLKDTGRFYYVPTSTGTSELTVTGTDPDGTPAGPITITVEFFNVSDGYSTTGQDRVTTGTTPLDRHRQQQRLKYFGFPGKSGSPLVVDGIAGTGQTNTRWAIGLFNAAVTNTDHSYSSNINGTYINALNAPRWKDLPASGTNWTRSPTGCGGCAPENHKRVISWTEEVIEAAGVANTGADFEVADISLPQGGDTTRHSSHEAGMDIDIETPSTDSTSVPFYRTHTSGGVTYVAAADTTNAAGATVKNIIRKNTTTNTYFASPLSGSKTNAVKHNSTTYESKTILNGIRNLITDNTDHNYDLDTVKAHLNAFIGVTTASGATVGGICFNDPRTWTLTGVTFCSGHGGHLHVNVIPPAARNAGSAGAIASVNTNTHQLDDTWTLYVGSQTVRANADGTFRIPNIAAPDQFGPGGPGTRPDFVSDDFLRVFGVSTAKGTTRYAYSRPFQITDGETYRIGRMTFVDTPPPFLADSIFIDVIDAQLQIGESMQMVVTAIFPGGTVNDVTHRITGTVYRTSNPNIATIGPNGLVTAHNTGPFIAVATNEGVTATKLMRVTVDNVFTTVEGLVTTTSGSPIEGATVDVLGVQGATDDTGRFSIFAEGTPNAQISATATATLSGESVTAASLPVTIVADAITDVGIIQIQPPSSASNLLFAHPIVSTVDTPEELIAGDFSGDGILDLISFNGNSASFSVMQGNGDGTFQDAFVFPLITAATSADGAVAGLDQLFRGLAVAQFTHDAALDIAVADLTNGKILILLATGDGSFEFTQSISVGTGPADIAVAKIDADDHLDLVVVDSTDATVSVLINDGTGTFAVANIFAVAKRPTAIFAAKLNDDDSPDLVIAEPSGAVYIMLNDGTGGFIAPTATSQGSVKKVATADLNNDGFEDLAVTHASGMIKVHMNSGTGTFGAATDYRVGDLNVDAILAADLDRTNGPDLVVTDRINNLVAFLYNDGSGQFGSPITMSSPGDQPVHLVAGDFNQDNHADVAIAHSSSRNAGLLLNNGDGAFARNIRYGQGFADAVARQGGFGTRPMALGRFDDDGTVDLASGLSGDGEVYFNGGNVSLTGAVRLNATCFINEILVGDLNGSGVDDIIFINSCGNVADVFLSNGDRSFGQRQPYSLGNDSPRTGALADLDGVQGLDLITVGSTQVATRLNLGDGSFGAPQFIPHSVSSPSQVLAGDVTDDNIVDVIVLASGSSALLVGRGDGTLSDAIPFPTGSFVLGAALGDTNGDGRPELIVGNTNDETVTVYANDNTGLFAESVDYVTGNGPASVVLADFDGDNLPDILTGNQGDHSVTLLSNTGSGEFANGVHYATTGFVGLALHADLDNDTDRDLVVGGFNSSGLALGIMLNQRIASDCNNNLESDDTDVFFGGSADCNRNGIPDECDSDCDGSNVPDDCELAQGLFTDCNFNFLPDVCETDCNVNGIPDDCDIAASTSSDCNFDNIPDECQLAPLCTSDCFEDCNSNDVLDVCEQDCDGNGIADECDIASCPGDLACDDCNANGFPDSCDLSFGLSGTIYAVQGGDCCGGRLYSLDQLTAEVELVVDLDDAFPNLDMCGPSGITLSPDFQSLYISLNFEDAILKHDIDSGTTSLVGHFNNAQPSDIAFLADGTTLVISDPRARALHTIDPNTGEDTFRCNTVAFDGTQNSEIRVSGLSLRSDGVLFGSIGRNSGNTGVSGGSLVTINPVPDANDECLVTPIGTGTGFTRVAGITVLPDGRILGATGRDLELIEIDPVTGVGVLIDTIGGDSDACSIDGMTVLPGSADCNTNFIPDECDIAEGTSVDINANRIPDECE